MSGGALCRSHDTAFPCGGSKGGGEGSMRGDKTGCFKNLSHPPTTILKHAVMGEIGSYLAVD